MTQIAKRHRRGRIQDQVSTIPDGGTVTLEEWKRLRAKPASEVHVVQRQRSTGGDAA